MITNVRKNHDVNLKDRDGLYSQKYIFYEHVRSENVLKVKNNSLKNIKVKKIHNI